MKTAYWTFIAKFFPAYHKRAIERSCVELAEIIMRKSPLQRALEGKYEAAQIMKPNEGPMVMPQGKL